MSRDVDELDELLLLLDLDLEGDLLDVLPDGEGDLLPDLDFAFFFVLWSDDRLSLLSEGVDTYPVSF